MIFQEVVPSKLTEKLVVTKTDEGRIAREQAAKAAKKKTKEASDLPLIESVFDWPKMCSILILIPAILRTILFALTVYMQVFINLSPTTFDIR